MSGAAAAVINRNGMVYHSKITDPYVTPVDNIITNWNGTWTGDTSVVPTDYTVSLSEAGPAKEAIGQKLAIADAYVLSAAKVTAYETLSSSTNLSAYEAVTFYIRSSVAIAAGNLKLVLAGTSVTTVTEVITNAVEILSLPAIPRTIFTGSTDTPTNGDEFDEDKWVRVCLKLATPSSDTAILAAGLWFNSAGVDPGLCNIYVQGLRGMHSFEGRTGFSISESVDEVDVSDYESKFTREFDTTFSAWTCSFEGHKEGAPPLDKGRKYVIAIAETDTVGQVFIGDALYTGFTPSGSLADSIKYPYSMRGTSYLHKPIL